MRMSQAVAIALAIVVPLIHLVGVFSAAHAVMKARTPQSSIAWAIGLISFPYLVIPLYWLFGSPGFHAYTARLREGERTHLELAQRIQTAVGLLRGQLDSEDADTQTFLERMTQLPISRGNRIDLLVDGPATFDAILAGIEQAQWYVALEFFIVRDDDLGRRLKEVLIRKARAGVRVYFLCDSIGSLGLRPAYTEALADAGIEFRFFRPDIRGRSRFRINFRNHRKIVVVDGRMAFVGGHNVGDEYLGKDPQFGHWRDTHVRVEGPAVQAVQMTFLVDWYWMTDTIPEFDWMPVAASGGEARILPLASGPNQDIETCRLFMVHAINTARRRLWIASPYFVPDEGFVQALQMAALRGVDVRIMLPQKPDHRAVYLASFSYLRDLIPHGVKIYRYTKGFLHEKAILVDDRWASIGTANVDNRSFRLNFEISMLVFDTPFCHEVARMFERDFADCEIQPADACERRGLFFRLIVRVCRLFAPLS